MLLVMDIDNTNVTRGLFDDSETHAHVWRLSTRPARTADEYGLSILQYLAHHRIELDSLQGVAVGSVVPALDDIMVRASKRYLSREPFFATINNQHLLSVDYDPPEDLGIDRVLTAGPAFRRFGAPLVVLKMGTATTIDAVEPHLTLSGIYYSYSEYNGGT